MTYQYGSPEFDSFGWPACASEDPGLSYGLDYESAREATPRWFAVSSGNGNDGVSHIFPDYFCRCTPKQAFDLAAAAMISSFKPTGYDWACDNVTVDGESDYTITAAILDPPEDETESPDYQDIAESNGFRVLSVSRGMETGFAWGTMDSDEAAGSMLSTESEAWKACCNENELMEEEDSGSWSEANGAWMLIDVFPVDDDFNPADPDPWRKPRYESLAECFDESVLKLAEQI